MYYTVSVDSQTMTFDNWQEMTRGMTYCTLVSGTCFVAYICLSDSPRNESKMYNLILDLADLGWPPVVRNNRTR